MAASCKACGKTISPFVKPRLCTDCYDLTVNKVEMVPSYGCCQQQSFVVWWKPKAWRPVFNECAQCHRSKSEVDIGKGQKVMLCVPCSQSNKDMWSKWPWL